LAHGFRCHLSMVTWSQSLLLWASGDTVRHGKCVLLGCGGCLPHGGQEAKRKTEKCWGPHFPFKGMFPVTLSSTKPHQLKDPPPPNDATGWGQAFNTWAFGAPSIAKPQQVLSARTPTARGGSRCHTAFPTVHGGTARNADK
jgi:hypothetical protein